jgi:hypothetical protein
MANFAEIVNGVVDRIVVISNDDIKDANGVEQEQLGIELCNTIVAPGNWVQTSFNNNFRKQYGNVGFTYNAEADVFIQPSPFPSWSLDENYDWKAPIEYPNDGCLYDWDESSTSWVLIQTESEE